MIHEVFIELKSMYFNQSSKSGRYFNGLDGKGKGSFI